MIALATLRAHLKEPDASENGLIRAYEQAAVQYVEKETGRYFGAPAPRTDYRTGAGQQEIWLSEVPTGVVTVTRDGAAVDAAEFSTRERRLRHTSAWGTAAYPVDLVIAYEAGYTESGAGEEVDIAAPADIRAAVLELVARMHGYRSPIVTGTIVAQLPHGVRETLNHWRRWTA